MAHATARPSHTTPAKSAETACRRCVGATTSPEAAYPAAAAALQAALREVEDALACADDGADDWAVTAAQHRAFQARGALRALLEAAAVPGHRLDWCLCGEAGAAD